MMSEMLVSFKNPEEILNFVNTVAKYPYDMDMKRGDLWQMQNLFQES